jgi:glutathione-specific gamma-glutamylcyclotransferase
MQLVTAFEKLPLNKETDVFCEDEPILADWVFGYGSLIWNPEVDFESSHIGKVYGRHRNFCVRSTKYRGTSASPGVVLGLDTGGSCIGVAYELRQATKIQSIEKLYKREMLNRIYIPTLVNVHLKNRQLVRALTFVANRRNDSYVCLTEDQLFNRLNVCVGDRGANRDYALNTWEALKAHGVHDERLEKIAARLTQSTCTAEQS